MDLSTATPPGDEAREVFGDGLHPGGADRISRVVGCGFAFFLSGSKAMS